MISTLAIEHAPIGDLRPDPFNPRRISDAELEALTRSRQSFGRPIAEHYEGIVFHDPLQAGGGRKHLWRSTSDGRAAGPRVRCQIRPGGYPG
jgi:hypothetical protein